MRLLIMKPGTWNGFVFDAKFCDDLVANYDPKTHEAPIVIGHRKDWNQDSDEDEFSHGWVAALSIDGKHQVFAEVNEISTEMEEMLEEKKLRYCSIEVPLAYFDDRNPQPMPELRALALLGRNAPAVAGARVVALA